MTVFSRTIGLLISIWFAAPATAWNIVMDFEDGNGAAKEVAMGRCDPARDRYRFTDAAGLTVFTDEDGFASRQAARLTIKKGTGGFGKWGGIISLPGCVGDALKPGDELWFRIRMKFPSAWKFTDGERLKFIRLRTYDPAGKPSSYVDFQLSHPDGPGKRFYPFHFIPEFDASGGWALLGKPSHYINFGEWETYQLYFRIHYNTADDDPVNGAKVIVWKNGRRVGEVSDKKTIQGRNYTIRDVYLFTYWNGERGKGDAPQTQSLLIDDVRITNERSDKKRNRYAGNQ